MGWCLQGSSWVLARACPRRSGGEACAPGRSSAEGASSHPGANLDFPAQPSLRVYLGSREPRRDGERHRRLLMEKPTSPQTPSTTPQMPGAQRELLTTAIPKNVPFAPLVSKNSGWGSPRGERQQCLWMCMGSGLAGAKGDRAWSAAHWWRVLRLSPTSDPGLCHQCLEQSARPGLWGESLDYQRGRMEEPGLEPAAAVLTRALQTEVTVG